jgi:hypothetical protein
VRFATTADTFYNIAVSRPVGGLRVTAPIPVVTLFGGFGVVLKRTLQNGTLAVEISEEELDKIPCLLGPPKYHIVMCNTATLYGCAGAQPGVKPTVSDHCEAYCATMLLPKQGWAGPGFRFTLQLPICCPMPVILSG